MIIDFPVFTKCKDDNFDKIFLLENVSE